MDKCNHQPRVIAEAPYSSSVAVPPYSEENRAAHGNITETQECELCGAQRQVNINQQHVESSPWLSREQQELRERIAAARRREEHEDQCRKTAIAAGVAVKSTTNDGVVVDFNGTTQALTLAQIREAAEQEDNGDGLVQIYTGMLLLANDARRSRA